jgi:serine/threonine protein kinase
MEGMSKEDKYIHFFIEFVDGLPFDDVLMKLDTLSEWQTCFYTSQVILMLDYLHCHGIVYRDLKAQNIICGTDVGL